MTGSSSPFSGAASYEVVPVTTAASTPIYKRDGSIPAYLLGFMNLSSSNQAVSGIMADLAGNVANLPQIGQLAASQVVQMCPPGILLYYGLVVTLSGIPITPGIAMLVR